MPDSLSPARLLAIIETQSAIAGAGMALEAVMTLVCDRARAITGASAGVIELVEGEEMVYHSVAGAASPHTGLRLQVETSLSGLSLRLGEVLRCDDAATDPRVDGEAARRVGATSMLCVPLAHGHRVVGVLKVYSPRTHAFDQSDVVTLRLLSAIIAASMANAEDFERQQHQSRHDTLTGLPNRRAFDERIAAEIARVARYGGELSLCLADLDDFKRVNDTQGHAAGDFVLQAVAEHLGEVRGEDAAFRLGGDEFAVIFIGAEAQGADVAMGRVARAVQAHPATLGVGLSWGIVGLRGHSKAALVASADRALYAAKHERRAAAGRKAC